MPSGGKEAGKQGGKPCPLPNVENPDDPIRHRDQRPEPAGFARWTRRGRGGWSRSVPGPTTTNGFWNAGPMFPTISMNYFNARNPINGVAAAGTATFLRTGRPDRDMAHAPGKSGREKPSADLPPSVVRHYRSRFRSVPFSHVPALPRAQGRRRREDGLETVWLFTGRRTRRRHSSRVFEIRDDEFADVTRLFATCEAADELEELEYYRDKQAVFLRRMTGVDMSESGDALSGARAALRDVGNLPKKIVAMREAAFGAAPVPPAPGFGDEDGTKPRP